MARQARYGPHRYEYELGRRNYSFEAQVDKIVVNTEKRMNLVMQQSLLNAINEMQVPVAKGGKMRVDTGFLRASGQSSLNGAPTGPSIFPKEHEHLRGQHLGTLDTFKIADTEVTIGKMKFGSTFFWGWTANYAKYREAYDGFMYSVIQNWQQIVNKVVNEAKQRFPTK